MGGGGDFGTEEREGGGLRVASAIRGDHVQAYLYLHRSFD